jgi:peptidoglycan/LPS O-acetylase OafA/YrhL
MKRVRELDGLRCFAILAVMACHYVPPYRPRLDLLSLGWVGVDLFFVISGYLITTNLVTLRGTQHPYRVFYWRRMLRIFPPYYLVLFLLLGIHPRTTLSLGPGYFVPPIFFLSSVMSFPPIQQVWHVLRGGSLYMARTPLFDHMFADFGIGVGSFWSLSIEEIFYLFWAPIILQCSRLQVVAISVASICICPILRVLGHAPGWDEYWSVFFRFDTLMMGSLLALLLIAYRRGNIKLTLIKRGLGAAGLISLPLLIWLILHCGYLERIDPKSTLSFAGAGYTLIGIFFTSVVGLCVIHSESRLWWAELLRWRPFRYVGGISYMMYLIHIPVWVAVYKILERVHGGDFTPNLWMGFLSAALTISLAALSWRFFEKPILRFKDAIFPTPRKPKVEEEVAPA